MKCARDLLSDYEYQVLMLHIQGYKTSEISAAVGRDTKSVDNAKARLFRRLRDALGAMKF
jgi:DNA-directed RNA polymerase specialized sigma24 family protein